MCDCTCGKKDQLKVGDVLYGYCNGHFGRDSYYDKTIEAIGPDWVVVRYDDWSNSGRGTVGVYQGDLSVLLRYRNEPDEYGDYPE